MDIKDIYGLWDRFDSSDADRLELELQGDRLTLERNCSSVNAVKTTSVSETKTIDNKSASVAVSTASEKEEKVEPAKASDNLSEIKAPLVGTFYAAPSPDAKPYVSVGQKVKKGEVVGIIEAMKLMNEITASEDCEIAEILVKDETLVSYDQVLFTVIK